MLLTELTICGERRNMRKLLFAAIVFIVAWSNIWWPWGSAYLVCALAVIAGYAIDAAYVIAYHRHGARIKRRIAE